MASISTSKVVQFKFDNMSIAFDQQDSELLMVIHLTSGRSCATHLIKEGDSLMSSSDLKNLAILTYLSISVIAKELVKEPGIEQLAMCAQIITGDDLNTIKEHGAQLKATFKFFEILQKDYENSTKKIPQTTN